MKKNKFQIKREATYAKLMKAGMEVFCEKGYSTATIDEIAGRAGFSKGAFYVHFHSKEDLFTKMIDYRREMRADTHEHMERLYRTGAGLEEIVALLAEGIVKYIELTPKWNLVYIDFFLQAGQDSYVGEIYQSYYQSWITETKSNIEWMYHKGLVPQEANTIEVAKQIYALLDGSITQSNLYGEVLDGKQLAEAMLKLLR